MSSEVPSIARQGTKFYQVLVLGIPGRGCAFAVMDLRVGNIPVTPATSVFPKVFRYEDTTALQKYFHVGENIFRNACS